MTVYFTNDDYKIQIRKAEKYLWKQRRECGNVSFLQEETIESFDDRIAHENERVNKNTKIETLLKMELFLKK